MDRVKGLGSFFFFLMNDKTGREEYVSPNSKDALSQLAPFKRDIIVA